MRWKIVSELFLTGSTELGLRSSLSTSAVCARLLVDDAETSARVLIFALASELMIPA